MLTDEAGKRSREESHSALREEMNELRFELALLKRMRTAASQTTLNEESIAKDFERRTTIVPQFPLKELSGEQHKAVIQKCLALLKQMKFKTPGKIDLVLVPRGGAHSYANLVAFAELKLPDSGLSAAFGQSATRLQHIFEQQPERSFVYFIGITPGQLELVRWQGLGNSEYGWSFKAEKMIQQQLTCTTGPAGLCSVDRISPGLETLARLLATSTSELGYQPVENVHQVQLPNGAGLLHSINLLCRGTRPRTALRVYTAKLEEESVVVKCGCKQHEVEVMQELQGYTTPHLPQLVAVLDSGTWASSSQGELLRSLVMHPYCQPLSADDGAPVLAQVAADIASTVDWLCNQRLILHRDISSSNIAKHAVDGQARGVLLDFGASKRVHKFPEDDTDGGAPRNLTGTPCFVSLSLLEGEQSSHTISTHLESLYLSIRHLVVPLPDLYVFECYSSVSRWADTRRGSMMKPQKQLAQLSDSDCPIQQQVGQFLESLHGLFWPGNEELGYRYCSQVTAAAFVRVCELYNSALLPAKL